MLRKTKNKLTYLVLFILLIVCLTTGTFPFFVIVLGGLIIYNYIKSGKDFRKRKDLMEDFLTHEYGEKMGKFILNKALEKKKK